MSHENVAYHDQLSADGNIRRVLGVLPQDKVNHPNHYTMGKIEVADAIIDWKLDFLRGNIVKYIARAGRKTQEGMDNKSKQLQDLKKARWYLDKAIMQLENNE